MKVVMRWVFFALFFGGSVVYAEMPKGEYLEGKDSKVAVILAHGQGMDPDSNVVGPLRKSINKEFGFHTLSLHGNGVRLRYFLISLAALDQTLF
jgi:hypothetical protein